MYIISNYYYSLTPTSAPQPTEYTVSQGFSEGVLLEFTWSITAVTPVNYKHAGLKEIVPSRSYNSEALHDTSTLLIIQITLLTCTYTNCI